MMKTAIKHKSRHFRRFLKANEAVSALEYALVVGVIATGLALALVAFEAELTAALATIGGQVNAFNLTTGVDG